jgi:ABC-2 type transport system permease protein
MPDRWSDRVALAQLTLSKLREYTREPEALFWTFVFPVLMALALGIAFRTERAGPIRVGVEAESGSARLVAALEHATGFTVRVLPDDSSERALRDGEVDVVVRPGSPPVYRYDPARPESRLARLAVDGALQRAAGRADRFTAVDETVVTPGSRYIDWLVPGLLGLNIMATSLWSIGFSIVQMRTRKLLKRLVATPMRRRDFLTAQLGARLLFLLPETASLVLFAWLVFGVEIRGSLVIFGLVVLVGALAFSGLGVLVASRARTVEAVSGLLNVTMLPMWVLSGIFFSTSHFPSAMQPIIKAIPLTALNDALRAVMLEGAGLGSVALELGILGVWGLVGFVVALRTFRWL